MPDAHRSHSSATRTAPSLGASRRTSGWLMTLCGVLLGLTACGDGSGDETASEEVLSAEPHTRVLVVGMDGLEWSVLRPLLAQGKCPNFASLMQRGVFGPLGTFTPTWSPVVWTSVATGRAKAHHGIHGFTDNKGRVYTSSRRSGRALWDIADRYGLRTGVVGWFTTWPVAQIDGLMVSGTNAEAQLMTNWKPALMPGIEDQVHPPELAERVFELADVAGSQAAVEELADRVFGPGVIHDLPPREAALVRDSLWSLQSDLTYAALAEDLFADESLDLMMAYFGGTDVLGHRFWRQLHPEQFAWQGTTPELDNALACTIPRYYEFADEILGRLMATVGDDVTVIVLSDHGMHEEPGAVLEEQELGATGHHMDGTPGVLMAAGPGIRSSQWEYARFLEHGTSAKKGTVYDIAPTVLGLLGIPGSREFAGRLKPSWIADELRDAIVAQGLVASHDVGFREASLLAAPESANEAFDERMTALGYLGGAAEESARIVNPDNFEPAVGPSACR